ncbi:MAG: hypothetical protein JNN04_07405 [Cyclobacteriaceae bacterium]|nr:hypothetical protein [Cyclobacteriaceae bacterium]
MSLVTELENGFFKIEATGAVLSPEQFKKLETLTPTVHYFIIVDPELQRLRTEAGDKSPIIEFKD